MSDQENRDDIHGILDLDIEQMAQIANIFFEESKIILEDLDKLILAIEQDPLNQEMVGSLFRKLHTLKGSAGAVAGAQLFGSLSHEFEALIERFRKNKVAFNKPAIDLFLHSTKLLKILSQNLKASEEIHPEELSEVIEVIGRFGMFVMPDPVDIPASIKQPMALRRETKERKEDDNCVKLSIEQVNDLVKVSSELVVIKNLYQILGQAVDIRTQPNIYEKRQSDLFQTLNKLTDILQDKVVSIQKITIHEAFEGLQALIRQTSVELKKDVQLQQVGFELAVNKTLASDIYQSLVHIIRNSLDHGIELPQERLAAGKAPEGLIKISAEEKNGHIYFVIKDDGRGLNKDILLKKAIEKKLIQPESANDMTEQEIFHLIFHPGFSTKEKVSTISGRGIGMDVVKDTVSSYEGKILLKSTLGQGLTITLDIPIPRKIMVEQVLLNSWENFQFAVPISSIVRVGSCKELILTETGDYRFCQLDGKTVPLLNYREICENKAHLSAEEVRTKSVIFIRSKNSYLALIVDEVRHQMELVIKAFDQIVKNIVGFRGSSILADDRVTFVIDSNELLSLIAKHKNSEDEPVRTAS